MAHPGARRFWEYPPTPPGSGDADAGATGAPPWEPISPGLGIGAGAVPGFPDDFRGAKFGGRPDEGQANHGAAVASIPHRKICDLDHTRGMVGIRSPITTRGPESSVIAALGISNRKAYDFNHTSQGFGGFTVLVKSSHSSRGPTRAQGRGTHVSTKPFPRITTSHSASQTRHSADGTTQRSEETHHGHWGWGLDGAQGSSPWSAEAIFGLRTVCGSGGGAGGGVGGGGDSRCGLGGAGFGGGALGCIGFLGFFGGRFGGVCWWRGCGHAVGVGGASGWSAAGFGSGWLAGFNEQYRRWMSATGATMRIPRTPGEAVEVDWAGDPMSYADPLTGTSVRAWLRRRWRCGV